MSDDYITIYLRDLNYVSNKKFYISLNIILPILESILLIFNSIKYKDYIDNKVEYDVGKSSFILIGVCHIVYSMALAYFIYLSYKRVFPLWIFLFSSILLVVKFIIQFKYMGLIEDMNDLGTLFFLNVAFYISNYVILLVHIFVYLYILLFFS